MHLPQKGQFLLSQYRTPHYPDHYLRLPSGYAECRQLPVDRFHVHRAYWPCARSRVFALKHRIGYSEPLPGPLHWHLLLPPEPLPPHCFHLPPVLPPVPLPLRCCRHPLELQTHHCRRPPPEPQAHHCRRPLPEPQAHRCRLHPLPEPLPLHRHHRQLDSPRHSKDRFLSRVH